MILKLFINIILIIKKLNNRSILLIYRIFDAWSFFFSTKEGQSPKRKKTKKLNGRS